jgi:hypothetical protein
MVIVRTPNMGAAPILDLRKEDRRRIKPVSKTLYAFRLTYGKMGRKVGSETAIEGPFSGEKVQKQMRWANATAPLHGHTAGPYRPFLGGSQRR